MLFQKSVDEGEIPMQWREANVTAIYKTNLLEFLDEVGKIVDRGIPVDVI